MRRVSTALGALVVTVAALKALASCVDLDSLGDGPPDGRAVSDAGPQSDAAMPAATLDPCQHAAPVMPGEAGAVVELPTFVLAVDSVSLDPAKVVAFDLDGVCTCDTRRGTAGDGGPTCAASMITCDLDGGVDNAIATVAAVASPVIAIEGIPNRLIASGHRTLLIQISKYNGGADDDDVGVGSVLAEGIHAQGCPSSTFDAQTQTWSKGGCGDDAWTVSPASVIMAAGAMVPLVSGKGYVRDYQLVVRFDSAAPLPFNEESTITFGTPILTGRLVPLDEQLMPRDGTQPPTDQEKRLFRLENGTIAGRILAVDLVATLGTYRQASTGQALCTEPAFDGVRSVICGAVDLTSLPGADPSVRCNALSGAFGIVAIPALAADVADAAVVSTSCVGVDAACP